MGKPIINKINTFDSASEYVITFSYVGNQPYKNRLVIINSLTNNVVLDETIDNMKFTHTIAASTLVNGESYTAQISVFDESNEESSLSDKVYFTCYTTPTFIFQNLDINNTNKIKSANLDVLVFYAQEQLRSLKTYQFCLYDVNHKEIKKSEIIYHDVRKDISYQYKNLENDEVYYIRCIGETVDNVLVDTGYYELLTSYSVSNAYNSFTVTNNFEGGYIQCVTNIVSIEGITDDDIELKDGFADIIGKKLNYKEGFLINGNYKVGLKIKSPKPGIIYDSTNGNFRTTLYYCEYEQQNYFKLVVENGFSNYVLHSQRFMINPDLPIVISVTVYITKKDDLYQLDIVTG